MQLQAYARIEFAAKLHPGDSMTIRAVYEHGVFRPIDPVTLAENVEVEVVLPSERLNQDAILAILKTSYPSGETDVAERHNEHQP